MISNRQRAVRVQIHSLNQFFARTMKEMRLPEDAACVCLVTNAQIAKWNAAYRSKNKPTDVLSFPTTDDPSPKANGRRRPRRRSSTPSIAYLGDIAIAPAIARRNARLYGRTFNQEMRILILHGILHLIGYDHETDTGQMERREQRLRRTLGIA
ncbi:MAG TPA: rRNA maturation RNase YbeY [Candidatus Acidoferrales bacterium]